MQSVTWLQAIHSTAMAGVRTLLSSVKKKAGPRKPIDCMIYRKKQCMSRFVIVQLGGSGFAGSPELTVRCMVFGLVFPIN
jgi:hypothetical protein